MTMQEGSRSDSDKWTYHDLAHGSCRSPAQMAEIYLACYGVRKIHSNMRSSMIL